MKMQDYFCEFFEIDIEVPSDAFDKAAFLDDIKDVSDINRKGHTWTYGSITEPEHQHGHMFVDLRGESTVDITIRFYSFGSGIKDSRPPYMEDCTQWLGRFVKEESLPAEIEVAYRFGDGYSPVIAMPFPLLTSRKALSGSQVIGLSVRPPRKMNIRRAIIQTEKYNFTILIEKKVSMDLKAFDLEEELKRLADPVMTFVNKLGDET